MMMTDGRSDLQRRQKVMCATVYVHFLFGCSAVGLPDASLGNAGREELNVGVTVSWYSPRKEETILLCIAQEKADYILCRLKRE